MFNKKAGLFVTVLLLSIFGAAPGFTQALFTVGSSSATAADIGHTELTGSLTLTVVAGFTNASSILASYSAPITNNSAADISVSGTGGLSGIDPSPVFEPAQNAIILNVPAGGTIGDRILVSGVRVAIAGLDVHQVTATLTSPTAGGNSITAGERIPIVVHAVSQPFIAEETTDPLSYENGSVINSSASLVIAEGFATAFSGNTGFGGQTVASRIRITPFREIPEGVQLTFNAVVLSMNSGATLTTLSGAPETIPRGDGSTDVFYEFNPATGSDAVNDSFQINVTLALLPSATSGTIRFQAALVPIGTAVPDAQFPSTDIPRYEERLLPDESELVGGFAELSMPFRMESDGTYTGIALTNPINLRVKATLTAYDDHGNMLSGSNITNPVTIILPRKGQYARLASEVFGEGFNAYSAGTIRVTGSTPELPGFYLIGDVSGPHLDGGTANIEAAKFWYIPLIFRQGESPFNLLELFNPGDSEATVTLRLRDSQGSQAAAVTRKMAPNSSFVQDVRDVFDIDFGAFSGGHIKGESDEAVVARSTFGNTLESNTLAAQVQASLQSYHVPHFATGGQYSTELTIVNTHGTRKAEIALTLLDDAGQPISIGGNPANIEILPGAQFSGTLAELFPELGPDLVTGSIRADVKGILFGPFISVPSLAGSVRFLASDGSASAAIPFFLKLSEDFVYSHVAEGQGWFTGVAVLNPNRVQNNLILEVYDREGGLIGSFTSLLQPGERFSKLIHELVSDAAGQTGGYIRITSDKPLASFALFGTDDLRSLSAIPPQGLP